MLAAIGRFVAWVSTQVWRYGCTKVKRVIALAYKYQTRVYRWILEGVAFETIVRLLESLG